jgi:hypothetical protein
MVHSTPAMADGMAQSYVGDAILISFSPTFEPVRKIKSWLKILFVNLL